MFVLQRYTNVVLQLLQLHYCWHCYHCSPYCIQLLFIMMIIIYSTTSQPFPSWRYHYYQYLVEVKRLIIKQSTATYIIYMWMNQVGDMTTQWHKARAHVTNGNNDITANGMHTCIFILWDICRYIKIVTDTCVSSPTKQATYDHASAYTHRRRMTHVMS
jgi:hypothetical protein